MLSAKTVRRHKILFAVDCVKAVFQSADEGKYRHVVSRPAFFVALPNILASALIVSTSRL